MNPMRIPVALAVGALALTPAVAEAGKASHKGWPEINGVHKSNPGRHSGTLTGLKDKHNELLGGHGDDVLQGGDVGDVLWGDRYPSGQPSTQHDTIYGGKAKDFIYGSHGYNEIHTGGGHDVVRVHYGRGVVHCDSTSVTVYISHKVRGKYKLPGCKHVSYKSDKQVNG
ncbi:calcium-binding protein [Patulibacter sp. S7RM1-6]